MNALVFLCLITSLSFMQSALAEPNQAAIDEFQSAYLAEGKKPNAGERAKAAAELAEVRRLLRLEGVSLSLSLGSEIRSEQDFTLFDAEEFKNLVGAIHAMKEPTFVPRLREALGGIGEKAGVNLQFSTVHLRNDVALLSLNQHSFSGEEGVSLDNVPFVLLTSTPANKKDPLLGLVRAIQLDVMMKRNFWRSEGGATENRCFPHYQDAGEFYKWLAGVSPEEFETFLANFTDFVGYCEEALVNQVVFAPKQPTRLETFTSEAMHPRDVPQSRLWVAPELASSKNPRQVLPSVLADRVAVMEAVRKLNQNWQASAKSGRVRVLLQAQATQENPVAVLKLLNVLAQSPTSFYDVVESRRALNQGYVVGVAQADEVRGVNKGGAVGRDGISIWVSVAHPFKQPDEVALHIQRLFDLVAELEDPYALNSLDFKRASLWVSPDGPGLNQLSENQFNELKALFPKLLKVATASRTLLVLGDKARFVPKVTSKSDFAILELNIFEGDYSVLKKLVQDFE